LNRYRNANRSYGTPGPLRGMKLHTTDAGFRVVGIMNWQGTIKAGQTVSTPVTSLDFLPTFCRLANAELPKVALDGTVFLPALTGKPIDRRQPLVWAYYNALNEARVAMRHGKWKVLAKLDGGKLPKLQNVTTETFPMVKNAQLTDIEIYDIESDIGETNNLASTHSELASELAQKLDAAYRDLVSESHVWTPATAP
jgi:arylsulfatase A